MIRPEFITSRTCGSRAGLFCLFFACALLVLMTTGCSWLHKRQGRSTHFCKECIENSFEAQQDGNLEVAQEYLDAAAQFQPESADAWWNLAELSIQQDNYEKAATELQKYIDLRPTDPQGYLRLSQLNYLQSQYTQADDNIKETLRRVPNNIDALLLSARLSKKQADLHQASTNYYHVLQVAPNHTEATLELAELFISQKEPSRAAPMLRALARKNIETPDITRTHLNLGIAYGQLNRWEDAVWQLEAAEKLKPNSLSRDQYRLAYAHWKSGSSQQALKYLIEIADQGQWSTRTEALYSTITETIPNNGLPDRLMTVGYQGTEKQTAGLTNNTTSPPLISGSLLQPLSENSKINITPPEWIPVPPSKK